jgi:PAS domain S-box-containing protein
MRMLKDLSIDTLSAVFENSDDCVKLVDADGRVLWMNANGLERMEIDDPASFIGCPWASFWPDEGRQAVEEAMGAESAGGRAPGAARFSAFCPTARGTPKWWDVTVSPVADGAGRSFGFLAISRDVTERERARESMEVLLSEMRHRQRNVLTMATSLLRLHAGADAAAQAFAEDMTRRFAMLAEALGAIAERDDGTAQLGSLIDRLARPMAGPECELSVAADPGLFVTDRGADVVGVVMGELAVNSGKHGAFRHGGAVSVEVVPQDDRVVVTWSERARVSVTDVSREGGQGLGLMGRICRINNVAFELSWQGSGPRITLSLPADLTAGAPEARAG